MPDRLRPDGEKYTALDSLYMVHHLKGVLPDIAAMRTEAARERYISELQNYYGITFDFMNRGRIGLEVNEGKTTVQGVKTHGLTRSIKPQPHSLLEKIIVYLQTDDIEGLFQHNPSIAPDCDIFGAQYFIAVTLLHELMHAFWSARRENVLDKPPWSSSQRGSMFKPIIEGEAVEEHGWSMECSVSICCYNLGFST